MYVLTIVCAALAVASANPTCTCPADDPDVIKRLDDHDAKINKLIARTQAVKDTINRRKEERADADKDSKNMLLRLNKLDISAEEDKCPKKHFKCVTGGDSFGKRCVANLLVCDGTNDCLDGSDEDPNLCKFPASPGEFWTGPQLYWRCSPFPAMPNTNVSYIFEVYDEASVFKSTTTVESRIYWSDLVEGGVKESSGRVIGSYVFATRTATNSFNVHGIRTKMTLTFDPDGNLFYVDSYLLPSMKHCHSAIMHRT